MNKIMDLASNLSFIEPNSKNVNEQSIVEGGSSIIQSDNLSINKISINNDAVISLLKTIPNISCDLLESLE